MNAVRVRTAAILVALSVLLAGCTTGSTGATPPAGTSPNLASTPTPEGTGPETPQQSQTGSPSIPIADLPIGGAAAPGPNDSAQQCADVNILAPSPLPDGVAVQVGKLSLSPEGVFELGGTACRSDQTPCTSAVHWTASSPSLECVVPVRQIAGADTPVTLHVSGIVTCPSQTSCDEFRAKLDLVNAHIELEPLAILPGGGSGATQG